MIVLDKVKQIGEQGEIIDVPVVNESCLHCKSLCWFSYRYRERDIYACLSWSYSLVS